MVSSRLSIEIVGHQIERLAVVIFAGIALTHAYAFNGSYRRASKEPMNNSKTIA